MSSKWNEPNPNLKTTWQNPNDTAWKMSHEEMPPLVFDHDEVAPIFASSDDASSAEDEYDEDGEEGDFELPSPDNTRLAILQRLGERFAPVLIPILFSGVTFLLLLPVLLSNHAVDAIHIWSIVFVFIAIAVLQGLALSYAGSDNMYWSMSIVGGFFLCLVAGCFALFGLGAAGILFAILLVVSLLGTYKCLHPVDEGSVDIVYIAGRYKRTLYSGPNFLLPWEQIRERVSIREVIWTCPDQSVPVTLTKDVWLKATISYEMLADDAYLSVQGAVNWEEALHEILNVELRAVAAHITPEDFVIWPPEPFSQGASMNANIANRGDVIPLSRLNTMLFDLMSDKVAPWGVQMNWVQIALFPQVTERRSVSPVSIPSPQAQATPQKIGGGNAAPAGQNPPPVQQSQPASVVPPLSTQPPPFQKEDALIKAYQQIKEEKIKSPETIRSIAAQFLAIANDPEQSKLVGFDATRAAQTLYERAALYERSSMTERPAMYGRQEIYEEDVVEADYTDDDIPPFPGHPYREPNDDNMTAGG